MLSILTPLALALSSESAPAHVATTTIVMTHAVGDIASAEEPPASSPTDPVLRRRAGSPPFMILPAPPQSSGQIRQLLMKGDFEGARKAIDDDLRSESLASRRSSLFALRSAIDAELKDVEAYRRDVAEAVKLSDVPELLLPQLIVHASDTDEKTAIDLIGQLARAHQNVEGGLEEIMVWSLMQQLYQAGHRKVYDELVLALAAISYGSIMSKDRLNREAAEILGARGDLTKALEYARRFSERDAIIDLLTDRRYAPLWPELERTSGEKLEIAGRKQLASASAEFKANPDQLDARLQLMRAYMDLGLFAEANKLGQDIGRNRDELLALTATTAYVVDTHANILLHTNGIEAADRRFAALVDTWTPQRGWVINMAINRIAMLFAAHRYEQALKLLDEQRWQLQGFSSAYAKQLLRALRVGSLVGLGRRSQALALAPDILAHANDAPAATLGSLLLVDADADAERLTLEWLKDPHHRTTVLQLLRIDDSSKVDDPLASKVMARFRARPAVAKAFATYGRDLPEALRRSF